MLAELLRASNHSKRTKVTSFKQQLLGDLAAAIWLIERQKKSTRQVDQVRPVIIYANLSSTKQQLLQVSLVRFPKHRFFTIYGLQKD